MKKKILIVSLIFFLILTILGFIANYIDDGRVSTGHEPKFCIKVVSKDGNRVTYWGLGYKVIRYVGVLPNEPYENNIGVKMGSWFMKYELPDYVSIKLLYEGETITITDTNDIETIENILLYSKYNYEICGGINTYTIIMNQQTYYIKEDCSVIQKDDKQAKITKEDLATLKNIIFDKLENSEEHSFFGKVIESTTTYIIVEPNEDEDERKTADKISISLKKSNDELYEVGTNLKITYDGNIMESYPAQIKASKIEIKSIDNFEIIFKEIQKNDSSNNKYVILDKTESDKYDYNIYAYGGKVNIKIDGNEYPLKEALITNKITMNEIIVKANQDEKDGKIKVIRYKDGGSIIYKYDSYAIIKFHTLDGNRDVYFGNNNIDINVVD